MSYLEIKAIKAIAAVHRGVVNTAIRTLSFRERIAYKRHTTKHEYAESLERLAQNTFDKAAETRTLADTELSDSVRALNAASNTVLNLRDDLNRI